ncbi:MAG: 4'-phosphopantetheinyl transferase superfamily protein [Salinivirgaceae bacterium]|jgi:4'-phosphopantetheinyl transferase|nr:4'-phosphopantetheinyl transferase superfamily protein [Salinivirgaceae bacterium]
MPFRKQIWLGAETAIQFWDLQEKHSELEYMVQLSDSEQKYYNKFTNTKRKSEFLASRILQRKVIPNKHILYLDTGAPILNESGCYISIAHSTETACFMHSKYHCGVDIETITSRALRVAKRFLNSKEFKFIGEEFPARDATLLWSAKESIYKMLGRIGIDFATQLIITSIETSNRQHMKVSVINDGHTAEYELSYTFFDNQVVTWIVDDKI